jgi:phosphatidylglycerol:prolipoprotein diacylglycerol transferase
MIPYVYEPRIDFGIFHLNTWGLIVAVGFLVSLVYAKKRAKTLGLSRKHIAALSLLSVFSGIIGSRIVYCLSANSVCSFTGFFRLWDGGLSFMGGLIFALLSAFVYAKLKKLDFQKYADAFAPPLVLGHMIGRIACIVADGGHLGTSTSLPWAVLGRHPTAVYSFLALSLILFLLLIIEKKRKRAGAVFFSYLSLYSVFRFLIDFLRTDKIWLNLTLTQFLLLPVFVFSAIWFFHEIIHKKK